MTSRHLPETEAGRGSTALTDEIARFGRIADAWWDPDGDFRPLHQLNPVRIAYIRDQVCRHFGRDPAGPRPFAGLRMIDIGCGGGLVAEALARLGADVTAIDASAESVKVAEVHAGREGLAIRYRCAAPEDLAGEGAALRRRPRPGGGRARRRPRPLRRSGRGAAGAAAAPWSSPRSTAP